MDTAALKRLNLDSGSWETLATAPNDKTYARNAGLAMSDDAIYFMTGTTSSPANPTNDSIHKYDIASNTWSVITASISDTNTLGSKKMMYNNNKLYILKQDNKVFVYDLITNELTRLNGLILTNNDFRKLPFVDIDGSLKFCYFANTGGVHKVYSYMPETPSLNENELIINTYGSFNQTTLVASDELDIIVPIKEVLQGDATNIGKYVKTYKHNGTAWVEINGKI